MLLVSQWILQLDDKLQKIKKIKNKKNEQIIILHHGRFMVELLQTVNAWP